MSLNPRPIISERQRRQAYPTRQIEGQSEVIPPPRHGPDPSSDDEGSVVTVIRANPTTSAATLAHRLPRPGLSPGAIQAGYPARTSPFAEIGSLAQPSSTPVPRGTAQIRSALLSEASNLRRDANQIEANQTGEDWRTASSRPHYMRQLAKLLVQKAENPLDRAEEVAKLQQDEVAYGIEPEARDMSEALFQLDAGLEGEISEARQRIRETDQDDAAKPINEGF